MDLLESKIGSLHNQTDCLDSQTNGLHNWIEFSFFLLKSYPILSIVSPNTPK